MSRLASCAVAALALCAQAAHAVEILRWERLPLAVPLHVDQERVVFIDRNVRVGVPASIGTRLRVQSAGGAIYLRASAPIEPTRLQLQDTDTGAVILLDIVAEPAQERQAPLEPMRIVEGDAAPRRYGEQPASANEEDDASATPPDLPRLARETPAPVVLTRYAAQSLYAPLRTVEPVPGIARVNVRRDLDLGPLLPTAPVRAQALAAWRLDGLWVSAVRLRNTAASWLDLDPRALQGDFMTATFQHPSLGPAGTPDDTTVVYLVTRRRGLAEALLPVISPIDAMLNLPGPASDGGNGGGDEE